MITPYTQSFEYANLMTAIIPIYAVLLIFATVAYAYVRINAKEGMK